MEEIVPQLKSIFQVTKEPSRILKELALYSEYPLDPDRTLIIFDEIQECEEALNSLKYFYEDAPQYHIIGAGSLLGVVAKRRGMTVPVGKVNVMRMFPVTFKEIRYSILNLQYNEGLLSCPAPLAAWFDKICNLLHDAHPLVK